MDILSCLNDEFGFCIDSVTNLSKTDDNYFIICDVNMFGWDNLNKMLNEEDFQTVDAIYPFLDDEGLTLYFFEFKHQDVLDDFFDARILFRNCIKEMKKCEYGCKYTESLKDIKKKLISKKIISLKLKPLESLILLNNVLEKHNIPSEEVIKVNKEYYVVSLTDIPKNFKNRPNKSNSRRKGRLKEVFDFRNKISPFPFSEAEPLNEKTFISLISDLEGKNLNFS